MFTQAFSPAIRKKQHVRLYDSKLFSTHTKEQRELVVGREPKIIPCCSSSRARRRSHHLTKGPFPDTLKSTEAMAGGGTSLTQTEEWAHCQGSSQGCPRRDISPIAWAWHRSPWGNERSCHDCLADWGESLPGGSDRHITRQTERTFQDWRRLTMKCLGEELTARKGGDQATLESNRHGKTEG